MEAIILAGGLGTRLRSVVNEVPKCMASVCGEPFLHYQLQYLSQFKEIDHVILSVGYLRDVIYKWIDKRGNLPFDITYAIEESPLGTGGGIKLAVSKTRGADIVILNGDTFFDVDLRKLCEKNDGDYAIKLALKEMTNFDRYGSVRLQKDGTIIAFEEKHFCEKGFINGGVYYIDKNKIALSDLPDKGSFEELTLKPLATQKRLYGHVCNGYFIDIGIPEDYQKANIDFAKLFQR